MFGRQIELSTKGLQLSPLSSNGGWWPLVHEPFTGAWQRNVEISAGSALSYFAVYACYRLITTDIGKLCLRLVEQDRHGIWSETESPAFSPVLRKPNAYQTINKYVEQYIGSKLLHGNAYVLKARDQRGVVTALYVLDPTKVTPMVTPDGAIYYQLTRDDLSRLPEQMIVVPAREIIHDTMIAPYHPLIGVSPIYACGTAAVQGLSIQANSEKFFTNGSQPAAILTAPQGITNAQAEAMQTRWQSQFSGNNYGKIAVLGGELKFNQLAMNAVDSQLVEQLRMTAEQVCSAFGVPPYLVDIGPAPPYSWESLILKYHSQCIQSLTTNFEKAHDEGLELPKPFGTEFDIDDLIWMDTATRTAAAQSGVTSGLSFNEVRKKYYGMGPVKGGESPLSQQQNYSIAALAERDANDPFAKPTPAPHAQTPPADMADEEMAAASFTALLRKELADLTPTRLQKRIEMPDGRVMRVTEESI
jgi:HK97 family phage portal protein